MRYNSFALVSIAALSSSAYALTFTAPAAGTNVDPTQSIVITWTSEPSDPSNFDLQLLNSNADSLYPEQTLGTGISTSSGSYTVPPYTVLTFGAGFQLHAISGGQTIGQESDLTLGAGGNEVTTAGNGQLSFIGATTANVASTAGQTVLTANTAPTESATLAPASTGGVTTLTGTATEGGVSSSATILTSHTSQKSSGVTSAATTSSTSTTANGQARLGGDLILSAAGVLAGVVALLA